MYTMKIGSGKTAVNEKGIREVARGYVARTATSLYELLKEHKDVKVVVMGETPTYNMMKAIARAQTLAKKDNCEVMISSVEFENVELPNAENTETRIIQALTLVSSLRESNTSLLH